MPTTPSSTPGGFLESLAAVSEKVMTLTSEAHPTAQIRSLRDVAFVLRGTIPSSLHKWIQQVNSAYSLARHSTEPALQRRVDELRDALARTGQVYDVSAESSGSDPGALAVSDGWTPAALQDDRVLRRRPEVMGPLGDGHGGSEPHHHQIFEAQDQAVDDAESRDPEAVYPPTEAAPSGGERASDNKEPADFAVLPSAVATWDPSSLQDDRRLNERAVRNAAERLAARLSSVERQVVMVLDNSQSSTHHMRRGLDQCLGDLQSVREQFWELQDQVIYNANAANGNIERVQDAFEYLRDRDPVCNCRDAVSAEMKDLREETLSAIYALQDQSRLFAIAADVDARDAEIQRSYDEETLAIRHNAESMFQQIRAQEELVSSLAERLLAIRDDAAAQAHTQDLLQQQVDRLQCTETARARADIGMHNFAKNTQLRLHEVDAAVDALRDQQALLSQGVEKLLLEFESQSSRIDRIATVASANLASLRGFSDRLSVLEQSAPLSQASEPGAAARAQKADKSTPTAAVGHRLDHSVHRCAPDALVAGSATMPVGLKLQVRPFFRRSAPGASTFERDAQTQVTVPSEAVLIVSETPISFQQLALAQGCDQRPPQHLAQEGCPLRPDGSDGDDDLGWIDALFGARIDAAGEQGQGRLRQVGEAAGHSSRNDIDVCDGEFGEGRDRHAAGGELLQHQDGSRRAADHRGVHPGRRDHGHAQESRSRGRSCGPDVWRYQAYEGDPGAEQSSVGALKFEECHRNVFLKRQQHEFRSASKARARSAGCSSTRLEAACERRSTGLRHELAPQGDDQPVPGRFPGGSGSPALRPGDPRTRLSPGCHPHEGRPDVRRFSSWTLSDEEDDHPRHASASPHLRRRQLLHCPAAQGEGDEGQAGAEGDGGHAQRVAVIGCCDSAHREACGGRAHSGPRATEGRLGTGQATASPSAEGTGTETSGEPPAAVLGVADRSTGVDVVTAPPGPQGPRAQGFAAPAAPASVGPDRSAAAASSSERPTENSCPPGPDSNPGLGRGIGSRQFDSAVGNFDSRPGSDTGSCSIASRAGRSRAPQAKLSTRPNSASQPDTGTKPGVRVAPGIIPCLR